MCNMQPMVQAGDGAQRPLCLMFTNMNDWVNARGVLFVVVVHHLGVAVILPGYPCQAAQKLSRSQVPWCMLRVCPCLLKVSI
jgi:hypothetical protein